MIWIKDPSELHNIYHENKDLAISMKESMKSRITDGKWLR